MSEEEKYDIFVTHSLIQIQKMHVHNSVIKQYIVYLNYRQLVPIPLHWCSILINYIYMLCIVLYYVIIPTYHFCSIRKVLDNALLVFWHVITNLYI